MKVGGGAIPCDVDIVAADELGFVVQGLRDVTQEVNEELQGLLAVRGREALVVDALGVVCDGGDDAALGGAVAGQIDGARGWRRVFGIDEAGVRLLLARAE